MSDAVIVSAARTAIGTAYKGSLKNTPAEELATTVLEETVRRSGLEPSRFGDVIFAESGYGGGDLARYAAVNAGLTTVSGQAVNRHCAGSLTAVGNAAANIMSGMEDAVVAGGVMSASTGPKLSQRVLGTVDEYNDGWMPPTHPDRADAPNRDMSITVGWNTARALGLTREELDEWAFRSHQRAIAAIDAGKFIDEIVPLKVANADGDIVEFAVDEHPRRGSTLEKLASLRVLHPEIEGFNITAGNSSGVNDAASALALTSAELAKSEGLTAMATVRAWAALGIDPKDTGLGAIRIIPKVLSRAGINVADVALWEINEAFASVPVGACKELGIDEELVNFSGSGCSLGHPVAASGARMLTTLIYELRRRGGGIGVAAMCAGGGQAGAVIIEVP
ncbi:MULTISPECIES: thiolase family protein [unclassified Rhodococcus (in: high G+C Gram-positive bacteria)]|uniref:thiolase family protein n=1 Tax=unclassified Rhodococcus (in: high G+C Gram-positive bacteria) TaxID=192944 RepID=UPI00096AA0CF|nr:MULTISPECIES: thiolase family protein [unclassified Rhodococcus (in: high G+C Gram-positive bacteria)]